MCWGTHGKNLMCNRRMHAKESWAMEKELKEPEGYNF
jgi:hypothetical protein